ncbi:MAG TPA: proteasome activator [Acidimicrobiia bacterium]|nr:proteasome activator [Acidimicrobiia bacterium]
MTSEQPITPDAIEPPPSAEVAPPAEGPPGAGLPTKLIRIASMTRAMLEEVRHAPLDDQGKARLAAVHRRSLDELREMLPSDLLEEFNEIMVPIDVDKPSEAELRIAQAQLIGWLEGLFHGIQASLFTQQMAAQAQLQEMARRAAISRGAPEGEQGSGLYL